MLLIIRGRIYFQQQQWNKASSELRQALELNPEIAEAALLQGFIYHQKENYAAALSHYEQAIASHNNSEDISESKLDIAPAFNNIGLIKYEMGATDEAIKNFQSAIKEDEKLTESKLALATALYRKGEIGRATELAQKALISDGKYADVRYLKENLWGEKMIEDAQELLSSIKSE